MPKWIVELEPGVFLADGNGDPPRTLLKTSARQFLSHPRACIARNKAREFRPFAGAKVTLAEVTPNAVLSGGPRSGTSAGATSYASPTRKD